MTSLVSLFKTFELETIASYPIEDATTEGNRAGLLWISARLLQREKFEMLSNEFDAPESRLIEAATGLGRSYVKY